MSLGSSNASVRRRYKYYITPNKASINVLENDTFFIMDDRKRVYVGNNWVEPDDVHKIAYLDINDSSPTIEYNDTNILNIKDEYVSRIGPNIITARTCAHAGIGQRLNLFGGFNDRTCEKFNGTTWQMTNIRINSNKIFSALTGDNNLCIVTGGSADIAGVSDFPDPAVEYDINEPTHPDYNSSWDYRGELPYDVYEHSMAGFATNSCCTINGKTKGAPSTPVMMKLSGTSWSSVTTTLANFYFSVSTGTMNSILTTSGAISSDTNDWMIVYDERNVAKIDKFNMDTYKYDGSTWSTSGHTLNRKRVIANLIGRNHSCMIIGGFINNLTPGQENLPVEVPEIEYYDGLCWRIGNSLIIPKHGVASFNKDNINSILGDVITIGGGFGESLNKTNTTEIVQTLGTRLVVPFKSNLSQIESADFIRNSSKVWEIIGYPNVQDRYRYHMFGVPSSAVICGGNDEESTFVSGNTSSERYDNVSWSIGPYMVYGNSLNGLSIGTTNYAIVFGGYSGGAPSNRVQKYEDNTFSVLMYINTRLPSMNAKCLGTTSYFIVIAGYTRTGICAFDSALTMSVVVNSSIMDYNYTYCVSGTSNYAMMTKGANYNDEIHCNTYIWDGITDYIGPYSLTIVSSIPSGGSSGNNMICVANGITETFNGEAFKVDTITGFNTINGEGVGNRDNYLFAGTYPPKETGMNLSRKLVKPFESNEIICTIYTDKPIEVF